MAGVALGHAAETNGLARLGGSLGAAARGALRGRQAGFLAAPRAMPREQVFAISVVVLAGKLAKEYWRRYDSPEFVIMFLPSEGLLSAALEARPDLIQQGLDKKVFLATPTTLLAMVDAAVGGMLRRT